MNQLRAILCGIITAVMVVMNGELSAYIGNYPASVFIHITGLLVIIIILLIRKKILIYNCKLSPILYSGGVIGVFTTVSTIVTVMNLDVSLSIALALLGQLSISFLFDIFGLFGMKKQSLNRKKILGLFVMSIGLFIMLYEWR